jgi:DNA-binding transcriptional MerR regulator
MAMDKLTPADKATLVKMIRDYLTSKGITLPPVRQEIKEVRKEMKEEIKDIRKNTRDAMQAKIKELRSNGKATFKEFTVTK